MLPGSTRSVLPLAASFALAAMVCLPWSNAATPELPPMWTFGFAGENPGDSGIISLDLDFDGRTEIIVAGGLGDDHVSRIAWPDGESEPRVTAVGTSMGGDISALALVMVDGQWILIATVDDGTIHSIEPGSLREIAVADLEFVAESAVSASFPWRTEPAVVVANSIKTAVVDATTLATLLTFDRGSVPIRAGEVDGDVATEILYRDGAVIEIRDDGPLVEWTAPVAGWRILLADLNGDHLDELVIGGVFPTGDILAYQFGDPVPVWSAEAPSQMTTVGAADTTRDGLPEVIVGYKGFSGSGFKAIDPMLGAVVWDRQYDDQYVPDSLKPPPSVGDLDGDDFEELIWAADSVCVADSWTGDMEWNSGPSGPAGAVAAADVDRDGEIELVTAVDLYYVGVFEQDGGLPRLSAKADYAIEAIAIGDADRDGWLEIVTVGGPLIREIDGATLETERSFPLDNDHVSAVAIADVDGDDWPEIVVGLGQEHPWRPVRVGAIEGATGEVEWWTPSLESGDSSADQLAIGDVDGDGTAEIVLSTCDNRASLAGRAVHVIETDTLAWRTSTTTDLLGLDLVDLDGDGAPEILTGSGLGDLVVLHDSGGAITEMSRFAVVDEPIMAVATYRDLRDRQMVAVAAGGRIVAVDALSGETAWRTPVLGRSVGTPDGLQIVFDPHVPIPALLVGADYSIHLLDLRADVVFANGFESGSTSSWSSTVP